MLLTGVNGVIVQIVNGTQDDAGVYTCVGERAMDRTYVSSWVHLAQPLPPVMLFLPCNDLLTTGSGGGVGSRAEPFQVRRLTLSLPMGASSRVLYCRNPAKHLTTDNRQLSLLSTHLQLES